MREYTPNLEDLRAFVAVAEASGFRRASRDTGVKQSVLSRRVVSMEDALGASLFERNREGVRLPQRVTGEGRRRAAAVLIRLVAGE